MTTYSLEFVNNSSNSWDFCVFQDDPNIGVPDVMSLAWFSKHVEPTTRVTFTWSIDYSFVWSETGELKPGILFAANQNWPADLESENGITLTYDKAYTFANQGRAPRSGNLYISQNYTIPLKLASVGIGMSGKGTFVCQATLNPDNTWAIAPL